MLTALIFGLFTGLCT